MAIPPSCCLHLSSLSSNHQSKGTTITSPSSKKCQQALLKKGDQRWKRRCMISMACILAVGLEMGRLDTHHHARANEYYLVASETKSKRWSDKIRICPPWDGNSLETIVPENLPRPSAPRRWEFVGHSKKDVSSLVVKVKSKTRNCFSM